MAHGSPPAIHMIMILSIRNHGGRRYSTDFDHKFIEANFKILHCMLGRLFLFLFSILHIPFRSWGPFWSHQPFKLQCTDAFLMCMPLWTNLSMQNEHFCNSNKNWAKKNMKCVYFAYSALRNCKRSSVIACVFLLCCNCADLKMNGKDTRIVQLINEMNSQWLE